MATKILFCLVLIGAGLLAGGGVLYFQLKQDATHLENRLSESDDRLSAERERSEKLGAENQFLNARILSLQHALDAHALRHARQQVAQVPPSPSSLPERLQPPKSSEQQAADRRAEWANAHAQEIARARGTPTPPPAIEETDELSAENLAKEAATSLAKQKAYEYFRHHWSPGGGSVLIEKIEVTIDSAEPKIGWNAEWNIAGEAYIEYYVSSGDAHRSSSVHFTADVKNDSHECSIEGVY